MISLMLPGGCRTICMIKHMFPLSSCICTIQIPHIMVSPLPSIVEEALFLEEEE